MSRPVRIFMDFYGFFKNYESSPISDILNSKIRIKLSIFPWESFFVEELENRDDRTIFEIWWPVYFEWHNLRITCSLLINFISKLFRNSESELTQIFDSAQIITMLCEFFAFSTIIEKDSDRYDFEEQSFVRRVSKNGHHQERLTINTFIWKEKAIRKGSSR